MYTAKQVYEEKISFKPMSEENFNKLKAHFKKLYPDGNYSCIRWSKSRYSNPCCEVALRPYQYSFYPDLSGHTVYHMTQSYLGAVGDDIQSTKEISFKEFDFEDQCIWPEKWYLMITEENKNILNFWRVKQPGCSFKNTKLNEGHYLVSKYEHDDSYYFSDNIKNAPYYSDYKEITFEQFKKAMDLDNVGKLAFKGFKQDLSCRSVVFEKGITYSLTDLGREPRLCSHDGYHYCNDLSNVFDHYPRIDITNRFCIIEILGKWTEDSSKGTTYSFRIIRELTRNEIDDYVNSNKLLEIENENYSNKKKQRDEEEIKLRKVLENKETINKIVKEELTRIEQEKQDKAKANISKFAKNLKLDIIRKFQEKYPHTQIGGSVGLFLHGVILQRFNTPINDFDIITPYYTLFEDLNNGVNSIKINLSDEDYKSGCDFDECISIGGIKADIRIDNHQKYNMIEFEGFKYKVSTLEAIWAAKLRYNVKKHNDDLREAMHLN